MHCDPLVLSVLNISRAFESEIATPNLLYNANFTCLTRTSAFISTHVNRLISQTHNHECRNNAPGYAPYAKTKPSNHKRVFHYHNATHARNVRFVQNCCSLLAACDELIRRFSKYHAELFTYDFHNWHRATPNVGVDQPTTVVHPRDFTRMIIIQSARSIKWRINNAGPWKS